MNSQRVSICCQSHTGRRSPTAIRRMCRVKAGVISLFICSSHLRVAPRVSIDENANQLLDEASDRCSTLMYNEYTCALDTWLRPTCKHFSWTNREVESLSSASVSTVVNVVVVWTFLKTAKCWAKPLCGVWAPCWIVYLYIYYIYYSCVSYLWIIQWMNF